MKSRTTAQFRKMFADLPDSIQEQTRKAYRQFKQDPSYPSLRFKKVHPKLPIYSAQMVFDIGEHYTSPACSLSVP